LQFAGSEPKCEGGEEEHEGDDAEKGGDGRGSQKHPTKQNKTKQNKTKQNKTRKADDKQQTSDSSELGEQNKNNDERDRRDSVAALHRARYLAVFGRCLRILRDPEDAAEAAQQAFLRLWRSGAEVDDGEQVEQLLWTIVTNVCVNILRDKHRKDVAMATLEEWQRLGSADGDPAVSCQALDSMRRAFAGMDEQTGRMLWMNRVCGLNIEEIAAQFHVSERTVRRKVSTAVSGFCGLRG